MFIRYLLIAAVCFYIYRLWQKATSKPAQTLNKKEGVRIIKKPKPESSVDIQNAETVPYEEIDENE